MISTFRSLAVSLALCAMVLRALLPDGWMPTAGPATGSKNPAAWPTVRPNPIAASELRLLPPGAGRAEARLP